MTGEYAERIEVITRARMAEKGVNIHSAFLVAILREDGESFQMHVQTYSALATFLKSMGSPEFELFKAANEDKHEIAALLSEVSESESLH